MGIARIAAGLACLGALVSASAVAGDEPSWNSRPLSHWVATLRNGDIAARTQAARGLTEIALAHGSNAIVSAVPDLVAALTAAGVRITRVTPHEVSLEELYMKVRSR